MRCIFSTDGKTEAPRCSLPPYKLKEMYTNESYFLVRHKWPTCKYWTAYITFEVTIQCAHQFLLPVPAYLAPKLHREVELVELPPKHREIQFLYDHSERHCTMLGRFFGIGSAATYLCAKGLWLRASDEDAVPTP